MDIKKEESKNQGKEILKEKQQKQEKTNLLEINAYILVNEIYSKINIEQILIPEKNIFSLMLIPKDRIFNFLKFEVHLDKKSIISKIIARKTNSNLIEENKGENDIKSDTKYSPLYIEEAENCYIVHLGKLPGRNKIIFKTCFIQPITSADMSYQYIIFNKFPEIKIINNYEKKYYDKDYYIKIADKDLEKIETGKINWFINFQVNSKFTRFIEKLYCKKGYHLNKQFFKDLKKCVISHAYDAALPFSKKNLFLNGVILFRTQMMNTPLLFKQYSPEYKETYYILTFMFDKNKMLDSQASEENVDEFIENKEILDDKNKNIKNTRKNSKEKIKEKSKDKEKKREEENNESKEFKNIKPDKKEKNLKKKCKNLNNKNEIFLNDLTDLDIDSNVSYFLNFQEKNNRNAPALFIILFDQTFAMKGKGIIILKNSLKKLLSNLPEGSYYQLIGFHTFFTMYNETPVEYNKENYLNSLKQIDEIKAEGLTNILEPLIEIYVNGRYNHIGLPRFIIMITDGQINNTEECLDLIEKNNNFFTLYAVGFGENLSQYFIRRAGYLGKGGYDFAFKIKDLENVLINSIFYLMRDYLSDIFLNFIDIYPDISKKIKLKNQDSHFIRQDEIFKMIFNINDKLAEEALEIIFHYNYKNEKQKINVDNKIKEDIDNRIIFLFRDYNYIDNSKNQENKKNKILKYYIRNLQEGNEINHLFMKNLLLNSDSCISPIYQNEEEIIIKYQILSKYSELGIIDYYKDIKDRENYEKKNLIYKTSNILKKNIPIEGFNLMDLSMDCYGLLYNFKIGFPFVEIKTDENNDNKNRTIKDKEWHKRKKEILAEAEEINKNVEKMNEEKEQSDISDLEKNEIKDLKGKRCKLEKNKPKKNINNMKKINSNKKKENIIKENKNIYNIKDDNNNIKIQDKPVLKEIEKYNKEEKGQNWEILIPLNEYNEYNLNDDLKKEKNSSKKNINIQNENLRDGLNNGNKEEIDNDKESKIKKNKKNKNKNNGNNKNKKYIKKEESGNEIDYDFTKKINEKLLSKKRKRNDGNKKGKKINKKK